VEGLDWSPRIICLKLKEEKLHVVSCYAPTSSTRRVDKDKFFNDLDVMISYIQSDEKYVLIGDFNTRVRSRKVCGEQWDKVRGPNGYGCINDAGKEPLSFLSIHQATVYNTWFQKKIIHI